MANEEMEVEDVPMTLDLREVVVEVIAKRGMTKADVIAALAMHSTDERVVVNCVDIQKWY